MSRSILVALFIFISSIVQAQQNSLQYSRNKADTIFRIIRQQSIYRTRVRWDTINDQFYRRLDAATSSVDQFNTFSWLLKQMGDFHSQVIFQDQFYGYNKPMPEGRENELMNTYQQLQPGVGVLQATILANQYGYISVPGISANDSATVNSTILQWRDTICRKINRPVKGWIIDLRANMGGSIYPMIGILSFLIGDIRFTGSTGINNKVEHWWMLNKGNVYFDNSQTTYTGPGCMKVQANSPVAILTSFYTVSSGEIVLASFKQRTRTIQIGETTGGLITNNHWLKVGKDAVLNLSVGYYVDRNSRAYTAGIVPDIVIKADENFIDLLKDKKVQTAIQWLNQQK